MQPPLTTRLALCSLRDMFFAERILICFNGPTSRALISEIGAALKDYVESATNSLSAAMDVFSVYIEMSQNIRHYASTMGYVQVDATATVVIAETSDGRYTVSACNIVQAADGQSLLDRVAALAELDKQQLKSLYKQQLRRPRQQGASTGAGLGLIDVARKSSAPLQCSLEALDDGKAFFTIRATI